jgi:hypothetical protein
VSVRFLFKTISIAFGIALLLAALFFDGGTASSGQQEVTPTNTLSATERLLKPTLPAEPSQADLGAQDYWLYCLPCHGERGQGLTEEFRQTYPPEEFNCWKSGCHGRSPYEFGFMLPTQVPAVIEHSALAKFSDAAQLNSYIRAAMPFWNPGTLTEEEAWRITAFLLRENGLWNDAHELDESNAGSVKILRAAQALTTAPEESGSLSESNSLIWAILIGLSLFLCALLVVLYKARDHTPTH